MELIPAIDLLDGRCVRLLHGDFAHSQEYETPPIELARQYFQSGASWLHVVDLAASRDGPDADLSALWELLEGAPQAVQTGGGVRCALDIQQRLDTGAERVVVGSVCVTEPQRFCGWLDRFGPGRLVAALDVLRDDAGQWRLRSFGWTRDAGQDLWQLLDQLGAAGLQHLLCTDISRDGALSGPNVELYREIRERYPALALQASGGIATPNDLRYLAATGAAAAICGKALLEGRFSVPEALEALA